jgi:hypothetical protein
MPRQFQDCPRCRQARKFASFCFAAFAMALVMSAANPGFDDVQKAALVVCAIMAMLGLFRHAIARGLKTLGGKPTKPE